MQVHFDFAMITSKRYDKERKKYRLTVLAKNGAEETWEYTFGCKTMDLTSVPTLVPLVIDAVVSGRLGRASGKGQDGASFEYEVNYLSIEQASFKPI